MARHSVNVYFWESTDEKWRWGMEVAVESREIVSILKGGYSDRFGQLYELKVFKTRQNTYVTIAIDESDADLLSEYI
jgi:hypothetical protein